LKYVGRLRGAGSEVEASVARDREDEDAGRKFRADCRSGGAFRHLSLLAVAAIVCMYSRDVVVGVEVPGTQQSEMLVNPESPRSKKKRFRPEPSFAASRAHLGISEIHNFQDDHLLHSTISQRSDGAYNDTFKPLEETRSQIYALLSYKAPKKQANVLT
jgi:hypothetical protein